MAWTQLGTIPENTGAREVLDFPVVGTPGTVVVARATAYELVYDSQGGFGPTWAPYSSIEYIPSGTWVNDVGVPVAANYVLHLGKGLITSRTEQLFWAADGVAVQVPASAVATDLATRDITSLPDGTRAWVSSIRDSVVLRTTADAAVPGMIYASSVAGRKWFRCLEPDPSWAKQDNFYVDPTLGNDEYDGTSATFTSGLVGPVQTLGEVIRRLGTRYHVRNYSALMASTRVQTIQLLGNCNESVVWDVSGDLNARIYLCGNLALATTSTISAKTDFSGSTPGAVTATWTVANELNRVLKTTISGSEYSAFVDRDNGASSARITNWIKFEGANSGASATQGTASVAAAITSHTFAGRLKDLAIRVQSNSNASTPIVLGDLDLYGLLSIVPTGGQLHLQRCLLSGQTRLSHGATYCHGCWWPNGPQSNFLGNDAATFAQIYGGGFKGSVTLQARYHELALGYGVLFQAASISVFNGMVRFSAGGSGPAIFCDVTTDCVTLQVGSRIRMSAAPTSTGCTAYGIRVHANSEIIVESGVTPSITGTSGDFAFSRTTGGITTATTARAFDNSTGTFTAARNLTWANLVATVASGGFGNAVIDHTSNARVVVA
jgi:hypothetical protein